jgi:hypothetical protein
MITSDHALLVSITVQYMWDLYWTKWLYGRFSPRNVTPHNKVLLKRLTVTQLVKRVSTFYQTYRFITMFTTASQWTLSWARWIQYTSSYTVSLRSTLILSYHLCLGLPSGLFPPSEFPTKILSSHLSHVCYMNHPSHPPGITALIISCKEYKLWSSLLLSFLHSLVISLSLVQIFSLAPCSQTPSSHVLP